jgi:hypothetical protein
MSMCVVFPAHVPGTMFLAQRKKMLSFSSR